MLDPSRRMAMALALTALVSCEATEARQETAPRRTARFDVYVPPAATRAPRWTPSQATAAVDPNVAIRRKLRSSTVKTVFTGETGGYLDVIKFLATATGISMVVAPEARTAIGDGDLKLELEMTAPMRVDNLLDLMVDASPDIAWVVQNGVVLLTSKAKAQGNIRLVNYDVRAITFPMTEFLPPKIAGIPTGDEQGRGGGEGEERTARVEPDELVSTLKMAVAPSYWDADGGGTVEYIDSGYLLINASPEVHTRVERFLDRMQ